MQCIFVRSMPRETEAVRAAQISQAHVFRAHAREIRDASRMVMYFAMIINFA